MNEETRGINDGKQLDLLLVLLKEQGDELRSRSQPELLYTAAAIGSFGAVTWGVAALPNSNFPGRLMSHPAALAAMGVFVVACVLIAKMCRDHIKHGYAKATRARVCDHLASIAGFGDLIPNALKIETLGPGYRGSVLLVAAAAMSSIVFCVGTLVSAWCYLSVAGIGSLIAFGVVFWLSEVIAPPRDPSLANVAN